MNNVHATKWVLIGVVAFCLLGISPVSAAETNKNTVPNALKEAEKAYNAGDTKALWTQIDIITSWLQKTAPRSGLSWPQAEVMMRDWVKKKWNEDVTEITKLSEGGMEDTVERHFGSFWGYTWDTGEKTVTRDFVFEARVKTKKPTGKLGDYKIRFHFEKGDSGWYLKYGGVMM